MARRGRALIRRHPVCHEYEFDWYEQARIAEKQRREHLKEEKKRPEAPKPEKPAKDKEPAPA